METEKLNKELKNKKIPLQVKKGKKGLKFFKIYSFSPNYKDGYLIPKSKGEKILRENKIKGWKNGM